MRRKHLGYTSPYLPVEIIWACGLTPVRLRPTASLASADGYLPRNFSVEARALLSAALQGDLALDAVVFLDEDDTSRRFFDVWSAYTDIPALGLVALPRMDAGLATRRYARALAGLAESLCAMSGESLTQAGLWQAVELYNQQRRLWRALRVRWIEGDLSTAAWHDLRWSALTTHPPQANAELEAHLAGLAARVSPRQPSGPRLALLGSMHVPRAVPAFLAENGARVVAEDSEADERTLSEAVAAEAEGAGASVGDLLEILAASYLTKPPGPRANALSRRLEALDRLLEERSVQGVIALYPKFADAYLAEYIGFTELFRERGLPALLLEDDGESGFTGQQRTRLQAFLEVLA